MTVNTKASSIPAKTKTVLTGSDLLIQALKNEGVEIIFGYPGGAVLPIYDALYKNPIEHVLTRHEQGAIHAAEGYARVTGKAGVVFGTSGPGATNLVTGIADAMMDSLPLVVFTGQVGQSVIGTDAFQEADVIGITMPITKHNYQVSRIEDLPRIVKEAFHIATTGRPGPVVVDIPKNISADPTKEIEAVQEIHLPGYQPNVAPNMLQIQKLVDAINQSEKPLILAGAGILHARGTNEFLEFVNQTKIPVVHTLLGIGTLPASHPLNFGMAGMHGSYAANMAICEADLLINIGARFDDRLTGALEHFAANATVAHIDIDPAEIGKNVKTPIPIVSDARLALAELNQFKFENSNDDWVAGLQQLAVDYPFWESKTDAISPQGLIRKIHEITGGEAIVTTDVGQHQMWTAQYYRFDAPHRWITSGGLGTMGFGFPAAIGAQLAAPDDLVIAVVGDGGFQMTLQELSVIKERNLPVKIVIVNNQALGMVRQWQEAFYDKRYSESLIPTQPDFVKLADSYGIKGFKVEQEEELANILKQAFEMPEPVLIDCRVHAGENVTPMVAPGKGLHQMEGMKP